MYSILCVRNFPPRLQCPPRSSRPEMVACARTEALAWPGVCLYVVLSTAFDFHSYEQQRKNHTHTSWRNTTPEVEQVPALSVTAAQLSTQPCSDPPPSTALHTTHRALCPRYRSRLRVRPRAWPCAGMRSSSSSLAATFCVSGIGCSFACSALNHSSSLFLEDGVIAPVCCLQALTVARGKSIR